MPIDDPKAILLRKLSIRQKNREALPKNVHVPKKSDTDKKSLANLIKHVIALTINPHNTFNFSGEKIVNKLYINRALFQIEDNLQKMEDGQ